MLRWGFSLLGLGLVGLGLLLLAVQAVLDQTVVYSEYGATLIQSLNEVSLTNAAIQKAGSTIPPAGTTQAGAVTLASSNPVASTGVPLNNYYYRITVGALTNTTPANQVFRVDLYRWDATALDYTLIGTLYVKSDANPATGETARLYFNLGTTAPAAVESFVVTVTRV